MTHRALWISDLHLGSRHACTDAILAFLQNHRTRHLYLVGDIIDGWELRRRRSWDPGALDVLDRLLRGIAPGTRVTYLHGNHDEFLARFVGIGLGQVRIRERFIHEAADGRRYLVLHGHQFDQLVHFNRLLERVGSRIYDLLLLANLHINRMRRRRGHADWPIASRLKVKAKAAVKYVAQYEEAMVGLARELGVQGVICGHIHQPEIRMISGLRYLNCGDWVESCTALAEDDSGRFHLLRHHADPLDLPARGPGPHDPGPCVPAVVPPPRTYRGRRARRPQCQPELAGLL